MFCALVTTINKCKTEQVVDVFQVLKAQRIQKPGSVQTVVSTYYRQYGNSIVLQKQYRDIFLTVCEYLNQFEAYSNFTITK